MSSKYLPQEFESKLIELWDKEKVYLTVKPSADHEKVYTLSMFPYPSGSGLHVGHVRIYTGTDILARYFRMKGYAVLNPMGWDAFGLPAENAAIKAKKNPMDIVPENIANFKRQMKDLGFSFDWEREFSTTDPDYYKWTQWLFLKLYSIKNEKGERLVYRAKAPINWCPFCKTGLANEEVLPDGTHERCGSKTEEKLLPQWMMRITDYAERLLVDLEGLDWPKGIIEMQKNWIGKKEGISIKYQVSNTNNEIECFTTRPDTNFGATFIVLAPEHPFISNIKNQISNIKNTEKKLKIEEQYERVQEYVKLAKSKTTEERMKEGRKKTGVFTGFYAINNLTAKEMPIWTSDFVLADFGTGAVVGVPGHDIRDFEFAKEFNLPIVRVVVGADGDISPIKKIEQVQEEVGTMINSDFLNGLDIHVATQKVMDYLEEKGWGERLTTYHIRDWIFSRQRYWGEPFPLIYCDKCGDENGVVPVPEDQLPVELPYVKSYEPVNTGESPLSQIEEWVNVKCPICGGSARRETDTMPNWAGSCWYFLYFARFLTPEVEEERSDGKTSGVHKPSIGIWNSEFNASIKKWLPVDWYLGGAEHAVLHLLYARFWSKAFFDLGLIDFMEPFLRLRNVGMVLAEDNRKMSKSLGNVINPDDIVKEFGADTLRVYEAFMAPFSQEVAWSTRAMQGSYRFLTRIWQIYNSSDNITEDDKEEDKELVVKLQSTILKISEDMTNVKFNTSIAAMMEFLNEWEKTDRRISKKNAKSFLKLLAPFSPFITDQIWHEVFKEKQSIHISEWPNVDKTVVKSTAINIPVQVNGKVRAVLMISADEGDKETVVKKALEDNKVVNHISRHKYKAIYVPGKILNLVIETK